MLCCKHDVLYAADRLCGISHGTRLWEIGSGVDAARKGIGVSRPMQANAGTAEKHQSEAPADAEVASEWPAKRGIGRGWPRG